MNSVPFQMRRVSNHITRLICTKYATLFGIHPVIEYPKCGGTWLCRMLADAMQLPFAQYAALPVAMPSIVHGHWSYSPRYTNTTFLIRDGRDVMVSFYFHYVREATNPVEMGFGRALRHLYGPGADLSDIRLNLPRFIEYSATHPLGATASWHDYTGSWWDRPGVVYARYEALRRDCVTELSRIVQEHHIPPEDWRIRRAVDGHTMERAAGRSPGQEDRGSFIRKGVVGDWANHFSDEACQVFADLCGSALVQLGYEASPDWQSWTRSSQPANTGGQP